MACKDCGKKTMMIMSIISLVLGVLCLIISIVMIVTVHSDFDYKSRRTGKEIDICEKIDVSKSPDGSRSGFPYMGLNGGRKPRPKEEEEEDDTRKHYIGKTCFSLTKDEIVVGDDLAALQKQVDMTRKIVCGCKNARYGASALFMISSLVQIAGAVVLILLVLSVIMKEKPLKFKWLVFLVLHIVVLVLLLIVSIISQVYRISEDEAEYEARKLASALFGGGGGYGMRSAGNKRQYPYKPVAHTNHPNIEGKMFAFFNGLDFCFCIACIIVAALTFCKCGKCLLDEGEQGPNANANQNPNQSGFASQKPSTAAIEPKSRASTPAPEQSKSKSRPSTPAPEKSSSKTNASASTRQSKRDVAGDKKK